MTRYTVYFNGEMVKSYEMEEPVVFIGRLPENHIPISNMGISRRHVKIELDPSGSYILSDLNSLNGTLVNGKKVKKVTLCHGDKITIGKYTIIYEDFRGGPGAAHLETIVAEVRPEVLRQMAAATGHKAPPAVVRPPAAPPPQAAPQQAAPPPQQAAPPQAMPAATAAPAEFNVNIPPPQAPAKAPAMPAAARAPAPAAAPPSKPVAAPAPAAAPVKAPPAPAANAPESAQPESGAALIETTSHIVYKLDRTYLTIGSDEEDDIYASGFMVTKGFAAIEQRDGDYYISMQKAMAKVKVNGKSVKSHQLEHRDRIEVGSNTFRFMEKV